MSGKNKIKINNKSAQGARSLGKIRAEAVRKLAGINGQQNGIANDDAMDVDRKKNIFQVRT